MKCCLKIYRLLLYLAEVRLNYLDKAYQVTMSVQQLAVLLCFATHNTVTVADLETETQLSGDTLLKVVRTVVDTGILLCPDLKVHRFHATLFLGEYQVILENCLCTFI